MGRDSASDTRALAVASLGLAESILIVLVLRNIITLDELKDLLLGTSFSLEEDTTKARASGDEDQLTQDVKDVLMGVLERMDGHLNKPRKPDD